LDLKDENKLTNLLDGESIENLIIQIKWSI
jgi:hypothetical protein